MKRKHQLLVRNLVLAMVAADVAGIYFLRDRLNGAGAGPSIEDDTIAAADAQPASEASRELPRPAFGQAESGTDTAGQTALAEAAPVDDPAEAAKPAVSAQAAAQAPEITRIAVTPAPVRPKVAAPASKTIKIAPAKAAPRAYVAASAKKPVTLSVAPAKSARFVRANTSDDQPVRTRATFRKAFSGLAHSSPAQMVTVASGSLHSQAPTITAQFAPAEAPAQIVAEVEAPEFSQPVVASELAPATETAETAPAASELPAASE